MHEIIRDRFDLEFNLELVTTAPSVVYKINMKDGSMVDLHNPTDMPDPVRVESIEEPWIKRRLLCQMNIWEQSWNYVHLKRHSN